MPKAVTIAKKKNDRVDAETIADLLRTAVRMQNEMSGLLQ